MLLVVNADTWQVAGEEPRPYQGPIAEQPIAEALRKADNFKGRLVMALGSELCLPACITLASPKLARKRQAMLYTMEEAIPWAAEEYTADWVLVGSQALMVACQKAPLEPLVEKLEAEGFAIHSIVPLALLAAQSFASEHDNGIVVCDGEVFVRSKGALRDWRTAGKCTERTLRELQLTLGELPVQQVDGTLLEHAQPVAAKILRDRIEPLIELKRDSLVGEKSRQAVQKYASLLQVAAALMIVTLAGAFYWRSMTYESWAQTLDDRQAAIYERVFPGQRVPVGVRMRLANEVKRLKGLKGDDADLQESLPALHVLHQVLASLPKEMRYRILEIRIEEGRLYLVGEVRSHSDADLIAAELRKQGLTVTAPSTHRLQEQGVEFRITAEQAA